MSSMIQNKIDKLKKQINDSSKELETISKLLEKFPDLDYRIDRWKNVYYTSKVVSEIADEMEKRHSCGCCVFLYQS
jgi:predicted translin family RNA/ssDNA-binding protein